MTTRQTTEGDALFQAGYRIFAGEKMHQFEVVNPANVHCYVNPMLQVCSCPSQTQCKHLKHWNGLCDAQLRYWDSRMAQEREAAVEGRKPWQTASEIRNLHHRGFGSALHREYLLVYSDLYYRAEECYLDAHRYGFLEKAA